MNWIEGRVLARRDWTEHHHSLLIEAAIAPFEAGQFARLGLEIDGQTVARPYSLVNPPQAPNVEVFFDVVPGGPLSPRLANLEPGRPIRVSDRAYGLLVLSEVPNGRDLWLLASGTGLGPFLSILRSGEAWRRFDNIRLVHGVRHARELAYGEVTAALARAHGEQFRFIPFVSREPCAFALPGRIPAAITRGVLQERAGLDFAAERSQVLLCGNPGMVEDSTAALEALGLKKHHRREPGQISKENYW